MDLKQKMVDMAREATGDQEIFDAAEAGGEEPAPA